MIVIDMLLRVFSYSMRLVLLMAVGYIGYSVTIWWLNYPIRTVRVFGHHPHVQHELIESTLRPHIKGFWALELDAWQQHLRHLPWVATAKVSRRRLGTVDIEIRERRPVARWQQASLLDERGEVFSPGELASLPKLPRLDVAHLPAHEVWQVYQYFSHLLQTIHVSLHSLSADKRGTWHLKLSNGMELVVPAKQSVEKLRRFVAVYDMILGEHANHAKRVDLRYANGIAVAWDLPEAKKGR